MQRLNKSSYALKLKVVGECPLRPYNCTLIYGAGSISYMCLPGCKLPEINIKESDYALKLKVAGKC